VAHAAVLRQHESTRELEHSQMAKLHWMRVEQMKEQHGVENLNQQEYTKRMKQELLAQHSAEQKQIPKNVKVSSGFSIIEKRNMRIKILTYCCCCD